MLANPYLSIACSYANANLRLAIQFGLLTKVGLILSYEKETDRERERESWQLKLVPSVRSFWDPFYRAATNGIVLVVAITAARNNRERILCGQLINTFLNRRRRV